MSLGNKLSNTLKELEAAKISKAQAREAEQKMKILEERQALEALVLRAQNHIATKIEGGLVPHFKIENYDHQKWVKNAISGKGAHMDIWNHFMIWADEQELVVNAFDDHDGVGMRSWISLTVAPRSEGDSN